MRLPSNRAVAVTALVLGASAALASLRITPPIDVFAVVGAAVLAGIALTSFLASRSA